jgi:hypothetical protein
VQSLLDVVRAEMSAETRLISALISAETATPPRWYKQQHRTLGGLQRRARRRRPCQLAQQCPFSRRAAPVTHGHPERSRIIQLLYSCSPPPPPMSTVAHVN